MKFLLLLSALTSFAPAAVCGGAETGLAVTEPAARDVAYLSEDRAEKLDVWLPDARVSRPLPAVLLIHGGGWRSGDKGVAGYREIAAECASRGYAVFSINYRLNESAPDADGRIRHTRSAWPRNYDDCAAALRWVREEGGRRYRVDVERLAVMGGSAGGQLAMLVGARHPGQVRAIVSLYGFGRIDGKWLAAFAGRDETETAARAEAASPIGYFGPESPPLWFAHGTDDATVPVSHARWLATELARRRARYVYLEVAGAAHGFFLQTALTDIRPALFAFLERQLVPAVR